NSRGILLIDPLAVHHGARRTWIFRRNSTNARQTFRQRGTAIGQRGVEPGTSKTSGVQSITLGQIKAYGNSRRSIRNGTHRVLDRFPPERAHDSAAGSPKYSLTSEPR